MEKYNKIIRNFIENVWNNKKVELIPEYISKKYVAHTLGKGGELRGIESVKTNILNCHSKYKNFKIKI
ncbi:MAG: hypothetical protein KKF39_06110, partial [Nanoarchaeota archaeon]|nr:hypothetical protein [Nanoarchaeota archaeon]